jgi:hypothetical protein
MVGIKLLNKNMPRRLGGEMLKSHRFNLWGKIATAFTAGGHYINNHLFRVYGWRAYVNNQAHDCKTKTAVRIGCVT